MIDGLLTGVLVVLALNMLASLVRVVIGPGERDRLLGLVLAGTSGVAFLLVAAVLFAEPSLRDAALAICALTIVISVARIRAEAAVGTSEAPEASGNGSGRG